MIVVRLAQAADFPAIEALQEENLFENLSAGAQKEGFLSARFSTVQLQQMSEDLGIDAAFDDERLVGYLCACRCEHQPLPAILEAMLMAFPACRFEGRAIDPVGCYIYGPVCIARAYRGSQVLARLFASQCARLRHDHTHGAAFIAASNLRSLRAHTAKLGMAQAGVFEFAGKDYHVVAFSTHGSGALHG